MREVKSKDTKSTIFLMISLFFMFVFGRIVPAWNPVTQEGVQVIGIFIGILILMVTGEGMLMPGLLALVALIISDYSTTANLINSLLGNPTSLMLISITPVAWALTASGTGLVLAKKLLTSKLAKSNPIAFTMCLLLGFFLSGQFIQPTSCVLLGFPLIDNITDVMGYKREDDYSRFLILGVYATLIPTTAVMPQKIITVSIVAAFNTAMTQVAGYTWSYGTHVIVALLALVIADILYPLCMKFLFRVDFSKFRSFDITKVEGMTKADCTFTKVQRVFIGAFSLGIIYSLSTALLPSSWPIIKFLADISLPVWWFIILIILSLVRVDGKKILDMEQTFKNGILWQLVIGVSVLALIGSGLSSADTGIQEWLAIVLKPLFGQMSWPMFVFVAVTVSVVITNFMSDTVAGVLVATFMSVFAAGYIAQGINVGVITAAIAVGSMTGYLTGAAHVSTPILLGRESMSTKWLMTKGLFPMVLCIVVTTGVTIASSYIF